MAWLLAQHRPLIDAELAINEGAGGAIAGGRYLANHVQASEKLYQSYRLEVTNAGGHSSLPVRDNAIYHLAEGLARLAAFEFPARVDEVTGAFFERTAAIVPPRLADDLRKVARGTADPDTVARVAADHPYFNAMLRTTCVTTRLEAGHADNALPQVARATVNCRVLPRDGGGRAPASQQSCWRTIGSR